MKRGRTCVQKMKGIQMHQKGRESQKAFKAKEKGNEKGLRDICNKKKIEIENFFSGMRKEKGDLLMVCGRWVEGEMGKGGKGKLLRSAVPLFRRKNPNPSLVYGLVHSTVKMQKGETLAEGIREAPKK